MGLAVAMVLFLLVVAVILASLTAVAWGLVHAFRLGTRAARTVWRRSHT
jgi:hypothetical protein